jgi:hypothetical protein
MSVVVLWNVEIEGSRIDFVLWGEIEGSRLCLNMWSAVYAKKGRRLSRPFLTNFLKIFLNDVKH